jgi:hypothetical protein
LDLAYDIAEEVMDTAERKDPALMRAAAFLTASRSTA